MIIKRISFVIISVFLLISTFSQPKTYAEEIDGDIIENSWVNLKEDLILDESTIEIQDLNTLGLIKANTTIFLKKLDLENNKAVIQWKNEEFNISIDQSSLHINENINKQELIEQKEISEQLKIEEETKFYSDEELTNEAGTLYPEIESYPVSRSAEGFYEVVIGNRAFFIGKDSDISSPQNEEDQSKNVGMNEIPQNHIAITASTSYFRALGNIPIQVNTPSGSTIAGNLIKNGVYKIVEDYGNWYKVKFGSETGFVWKASTVKANSIPDEPTKKTKLGEIQATKITNIVDSQKSVIGTINNGVKYPVLEETESNYIVNYLGRTGYIAKESSHNFYYSFDKFFTVNTEYIPVVVNSKNGPKEVFYLEKGQNYEIVKDYGNWHLVDIGGISGFVWKRSTTPASAFKIMKEKSNNLDVISTNNAVVYDTSSGTKVSIGVIPTGQSIPIVGDYEDYSNWVKVSLLGKIGYINKAQIKLRDFESSDKYFRVSEGPLPVYVNNKVIGSLEKGEVYERVGIDGNWHRVQIGNFKGYVWAAVTQPTTTDHITNRVNGLKNSTKTFKSLEKIEVLDTSNGKREKFGDIERNVQYPIIEEFENWYKINFMGRVGFVNKSGTMRDFYKSDQYFEVLYDKTPVYVTKGRKSVISLYLTKGQTFPRSGENSNWHIVKIGNETGYVWKDATTPSYNKYIRNPVENSKSINMTMTVKANSTVYDTSSGRRVPFAEIPSTDFTYNVMENYENWVKVDILGREGYISKSGIQTKLTYRNIVNPAQAYSYDEMVRDIQLLSSTYPDLISSKVIGKSVDGRLIYAIKLGKGNKEILLNGSHHAREHMTTNVLMEMVDEYSQSYVKGSTFDGYNVRELLNKTSIWFIPMVNPDGVMLVQEGLKSAKNPSLLLRINNNSYNFTAWKANIRGVDLNRQYPANWNTICCSPGKPSSENYKGPYPLSEPEAKAVYDFTNQRDFKTAAAYHSSGEIIYWHFHQSGSRKDRDYQIAKKISNKTGYSLVPPKPNPNGGGFTDWFIQYKNRPSFTPEISPYVGNRPVPLSSFSSIWRENNSIGLLLAKEAQGL